ncbi:MAG: 30S ribosomal protein S8 [Ignavibacteriales bacterium]|jgi:small subunit ribosomal protein S8|nr:30S ribosomal protein S8 [Ignavibacteriaceae bacterium]NLH62111.1 30S ribosomal protein S8 [Ignavibacteriales bacterium]HOJ17811.1 30S ribosomal protein S8 [Ignavibacteriaceae bacterium]HPO55042.1 30S ribosomal protein S8 [Ignavibacteriaceae bacterium]
MAVTDPIADFLTQIRNAVKANKRKVEIPSSKMKVEIAALLKENKFISDFQVVEDNKQNLIKIALKYTNGVSAITGLKRISSPGLRIYARQDKLPRVLNGYGMAIISTSKGLRSDKRAKAEKVGGEVVCYIW